MEQKRRERRRGRKKKRGMRCEYYLGMMATIVDAEELGVSIA